MFTLKQRIPGDVTQLQETSVWFIFSCLNAKKSVYFLQDLKWHVIFGMVLKKTSNIF